MVGFKKKFILTNMQKRKKSSSQSSIQTSALGVSSNKIQKNGLLEKLKSYDVHLLKQMHGQDSTYYNEIVGNMRYILLPLSL